MRIFCFKGLHFAEWQEILTYVTKTFYCNDLWQWLCWMLVSFCLFSHQGEVGFSDSAVLEAAISPASSSFVEGDTKSSAGGEIQLMAEPCKEKQSDATTAFLFNLFQQRHKGDFQPKSIIGAGVCQMREAVLKLHLHRLLLVPHLAVNADVPVFVHHNKVVALVQHTKAVDARRLCAHHVQRSSGSSHNLTGGKHHWAVQHSWASECVCNTTTDEF